MGMANDDMVCLVRKIPDGFGQRPKLQQVDYGVMILMRSRRVARAIEASATNSTKVPPGVGQDCRLLATKSHMPRISAPGRKSRELLPRETTPIPRQTDFNFVILLGVLEPRLPP